MKLSLGAAEMRFTILPFLSCVRLSKVGSFANLVEEMLVSIMDLFEILDARFAPNLSET